MSSLVENRRVQLFVFGSLLLISAGGIVVAYFDTNFNPALSTSLTTLSLVIITAWYVHFTGELLGATRGSYAPDLNITHVPTSSGLVLNIANRGEGVAKNIKIKATLRLGDQDFSYVQPLQHSLQSSDVIDLRDDDQLEPAFYVDEELIEARGTGDLDWYLEDKEADPDGKYRRISLTEFFTILDEEDHAQIEVTVEYTDSRESDIFNQPVLDNHYIDTSEDSLSEAVKPIPSSSQTAMVEEFEDEPLDKQPTSIS